MLLSNPLASPLLPPVGVTLAGLLASSLVGILFAVRRSGQALLASTLFVRWRTWLVILPLFCLIILSGPLVLAVFAAALAVQGAREYAALSHLPAADRGVLQACGVLIPAACVWLPVGPLLPLVVLLPLLASLPSLLSQDAEQGLARVTRLAFGVWYLPVNLGLLVVLERAPQAGPGLLLGLGVAVPLSDVGAFLFGRWFGRRRLAPGLSPSKTWAGVLGNLAGAALSLALLSRVLPDGTNGPLLAAVVGLGAVWGDLLESLLKRSAHVKDCGAWLPGFGGLLDRLDSLLVVLPLVWLVVEVLA